MEGLTSKQERFLIKECRESRIISKSFVDSNLIGEWNLLGFATFWFPTASHPCAKLTFTDTEVTLQYKHWEIDTLITQPYEVIEFESANGKHLRLEVEEFWHTLFINSFCENYMYGDNTPSDGLMHLYEKVK